MVEKRTRRALAVAELGDGGFEIVDGVDVACDSNCVITAPRGMPAAPNT